MKKNNTMTAKSWFLKDKTIKFQLHYGKKTQIYNYMQINTFQNERGDITCYLTNTKIIKDN